jgi:hypothetical protein
MVAKNCLIPMKAVLAAEGNSVYGDAVVTEHITAPIGFTLKIDTGAQYGPSSLPFRVAKRLIDYAKVRFHGLM